MFTISILTNNHIHVATYRNLCDVFYPCVTVVMSYKCPVVTNSDHIISIYRIAGMIGGDKVWRMPSSKVVGKKSLANAYSSIAWLIEMD